jgi:hypothetical protein
VGAFIGAAAGAVIEIGIETYKGEKLSIRRIGAAAVGGAISGATLGLASGAGLGLTVAAGAAGNTAAGVADRGIAEGSLHKAVDPKKMATDAAWGAAAGALAKGAGKLGARIGGEKELEQVGDKLQQSKLGLRHASRLTRQQQALAAGVQRSEKIAEQVAHNGSEAIQHIGQSDTDNHPGTTSAPAATAPSKPD